MSNKIKRLLTVELFADAKGEVHVKFDRHRHGGRDFCKFIEVLENLLPQFKLEIEKEGDSVFKDESYAGKSFPGKNN